MLILKERTSAELTVKNSRFLAEAIPTAGPEEAREIWHAQKEKYDNGGHIVFAFITGPQGNIMGCSDDGEPSGTAGRPTLEVLKGSGITNLILTTARWFGGTLLGTGGLVRAYTASAQAALENAVTAELVPMKKAVLTIPYFLYEQVKRLFAESGCTILSENFTDKIRIVAEMQEKVVPAVKQRLQELGAGKIPFQVISEDS